MKIARVEAFPIRLPRDREQARRTAGSPTLLAGGTSNYRWSAVFPALYPIHFETALVKITTCDGMVGWGEAQAPLAPEVACTIIRTLLAPVLQETEFEPIPEVIADLWRRMYSTMRVRGQTGGFMLDAISGIDIALWDLAGKVRGVPVAKLLSESPESEVQAYLSGVSSLESAAERSSQGFRIFKLFYESSEAELISTFDALQEHVGADARIAVDALWRLDTTTAVELGRQLDERNALWLEAPLLPEDPIAHGELARGIKTPIALGESYRTTYEMAPFFREKAIRFAQPDLGRTGITEARRIAVQAEEHGANVVPHVSIALAPQIAAAIHFAAATPACSLLEFNPNVLAIANRYVDEPLEMRGAKYIVPELPGLGVDINETALRRDSLNASEWP
jgi:D-galactarolactone cycloisomerase